MDKWHSRMHRRGGVKRLKEAIGVAHEQQLLIVRVGELNCPMCRYVVGCAAHSRHFNQKTRCIS